jgi:NADH pyrophosphatase NudC (nudix superfamily)
MERDDNGADHGCGGEEHGQHQETATQEHRCKKSIFARTEPVPQRSDKP